jgi:putative phosphonate metabolism protein
MSRAPRYAIYFAPRSESALARFGARSLGRDAESGATIEGYAPAGVDPQRWRDLTAEPRRYGFHATLKAPFRLSEGRSLAELEEEIADLARAHAAFTIAPLRISTLNFGGEGGFIALTPAAASEPLAALESDVVQRLDRFRAPLSSAELVRRKPERLPARQRELLERWGYPHVLDRFRFHMTLSNALAEPESLAAGLAADFAREVPPAACRIDDLSLFVEPEPGGAFHLARRFALSAG